MNLLNKQMIIQNKKIKNKLVKILNKINKNKILV